MSVCHQCGSSEVIGSCFCNLPNGVNHIVRDKVLTHPSFLSSCFLVEGAKIAIPTGHGPV